MYKCKWFPYPIGYPHPAKGGVLVPPQRVLPAAYEFVTRWKAETPAPHHYVLVKCFGEPRRQVFINRVFKHIEGKHPKDIARRYRFLPCVKELLEESTETPVPTRTGALLLAGKAAPYKETFAVIIAEVQVAPGVFDYSLETWYPTGG